MTATDPNTYTLTVRPSRGRGMMAAAALLSAFGAPTASRRTSVRLPRGNKYMTGHATATAAAKPVTPRQSRSDANRAAESNRHAHAEWNKTQPAHRRFTTNIKKLRRIARGSPTDRKAARHAAAAT